MFVYALPVQPDERQDPMVGKPKHGEVQWVVKVLIARMAIEWLLQAGQLVFARVALKTEGVSPRLIFNRLLGVSGDGDVGKPNVQSAQDDPAQRVSDVVVEPDILNLGPVPRGGKQPDEVQVPPDLPQILEEESSDDQTPCRDDVVVLDGRTRLQLDLRQGHERSLGQFGVASDVGSHNAIPRTIFPDRTAEAPDAPRQSTAKTLGVPLCCTSALESDDGNEFRLGHVLQLELGEAAVKDLATADALENITWSDSGGQVCDDNIASIGVEACVGTRKQACVERHRAHSGDCEDSGHNRRMRLFVGSRVASADRGRILVLVGRVASKLHLVLVDGFL